MQKITAIMLDMDGVVVDLYGFSTKLLGFGHLVDDWPIGQHLDEVTGFSRSEFWERVYRLMPDFWERVDPYPWFDYLYCNLAKLAPVYFLTTPEFHPDSLGGKLRWLEAKFGSPFGEYVMARTKSLVARPSTLLIDDLNTNVNEWKAAGGKAILFPQPWNGDEGKIGEAWKLESVLRQARAYFKE